MGNLTRNELIEAWPNCGLRCKNFEGCQCDTRCVNNRGYFHRRDWRVLDKKEVMEYWDKKYGFFRPHIGCILPVDMRSYFCLDYDCGVNHG